MKYVVELSEQDIKQIIADNYNCLTAEDVRINKGTGLLGNGIVSATIEFDDKGEMDACLG